MIYRLIILTGERRGEHITVTEEPMTIGRAATCDVRIVDPEMALTHAEITHRPGGPTIHDLGSMNRILVNHREVRQSVIKHGDLVELGRTRFLVQAYVQAEVEAGDEGDGRRRWRPVAIGAAVLLLLLLVPLTCHLRRPVVRPPAPPVATPAPKIKVVPPAPPVAGVVTPPAAPVPPPVAVVTSPAAPAAVVVVAPAVIPSNAAPQAPVVVPAAATTAVTAAVTVVSNAPPPAPTTTVASADAPPVRAAGADREAQESELAQAANAVAESKARTLLVQVRERIAEGDLDEAERVLAEIFWFQPEFPPALEQRARLLERRGRLTEARRQWETLAAATNAEVAGPARIEVRRLDAAREAARPPAPSRRVRIDSAEISKFPETDSFREMRLLTIRLASVADVLPDTGAVKVEVVFYERDITSGAIGPAPDRGPRDAVVADGPWRDGESKVVSASYTVPASGGASRATAFHGYGIRVFHHDVLQDATAQPRDLLPPAPAPAVPVAPPREPAGAPGAG